MTNHAGGRVTRCLSEGRGERERNWKVVAAEWWLRKCVSNRYVLCLYRLRTHCSYDQGKLYRLFLTESSFVLVDRGCGIKPALQASISKSRNICFFFFGTPMAAITNNDNRKFTYIYTKWMTAGEFRRWAQCVNNNNQKEVKTLAPLHTLPLRLIQVFISWLFQNEVLYGNRTKKVTDPNCFQ